MSEVREHIPRKTLNGKFDAYCHVCWNAVYVLWVSDEDPAGECVNGCKAATECPAAMGRARLQGTAEEAARAYDALATQLHAARTGA